MDETSKPQVEAEHIRVDSEEEAQKAEPGEIRVAPSGNVVIGMPTAVAAGEAPEPGSGG